MAVAKGGKKLSDIDRVPPNWPDGDVVRNDILDYAYEVEHFDRHLGRILETLSRAGALDKAIVVVTSDHGMPFPRVKGQAYEFATHVPLAMMWRNGMKASGRTIHDYVSFADLAPTLVELAGLTWKDSGMQPAAGRSVVELLRSPRHAPTRCGSRARREGAARPRQTARLGLSDPRHHQRRRAVPLQLRARALAEWQSGNSLSEL